jgi:hypothetical protein
VCVPNVVANGEVGLAPYVEDGLRVHRSSAVELNAERSFLWAHGRAERFSSQRCAKAARESRAQRGGRLPPVWKSSRRTTSTCMVSLRIVEGRRWCDGTKG